jgi:cytochrome c peroxidase
MRRKWLILSMGICLFGVMASQRIVPQTEGLHPYSFPERLFFPPMPRAEDNPVSVEGAKLGRYLFYDPILSRDSSISCATCHQQAAAFSDAGKSFSVGISGEKLTRNTPPLFNLAWYAGLFWDGRAKSIEEQALHPVQAKEEMDLNWGEAVRRIQNHEGYRTQFETVFATSQIDSVLVVRALAQFERTLLSTNSKYDSVIRREARFSAEERKGFVLANEQVKGNCMHCHPTDAHALGTTGDFSNNGVEAAHAPSDYQDAGRGAITKRDQDMGLMKIPSLRNVAVTAPYMHNGSLKSLEEVLHFYSEGIHPGVNTDSRLGVIEVGKARLSKEEQQQILAFLLTLTDFTFLSDSTFANPFR